MKNPHDLLSSDRPAGAPAPARHGSSLTVDRLVVIGGPPCAGKTTLIARLREGELPALAEQLKLGDPLEWKYLDATYLGRLSESSVGRLVVHYDLLAQRREDRYRYLPEIVAGAREVVFLTLRAAPGLLRRRSRRRLTDALLALLRHPREVRGRVKRLRNIWRRHRVFREPGAVARLYEDWFEFSSRYADAAHWVWDCEAPAAAAEPLATAGGVGGRARV